METASGHWFPAMVFAQRGGFKNLVMLCLLTDVLAVNDGMGRADLHAQDEWL